MWVLKALHKTSYNTVAEVDKTKIHAPSYLQKSLEIIFYVSMYKSYNVKKGKDIFSL